MKPPNNKPNQTPILIKLLARMARLLIRIDRCVLKRGLGIESPLYKFWWRENLKHTQAKLNHLNHLNPRINP